MLWLLVLPFTAFVTAYSFQSDGPARKMFKHLWFTLRGQAKVEEEPSTTPQESTAPEQDANSRDDIASTFQQYAQLIHASRRPLPTQTGDGSYIKHEVSSSVFQELKSLGFKDINTLIGVMKSRVSGEPVDDKTYLMERIIQAGPSQPLHFSLAVLPFPP